MKETNINDVLINIQNKISECQDGDDSYKRRTLEELYLATLKQLNFNENHHQNNPRHNNYSSCSRRNKANLKDK